VTAVQAPTDPVVTPAVTREPRGQSNREWQVTRLALQVLVALGFLLAWEFLPQLAFLHDNIRFLDPFVISAPTRATATVRDLMLNQSSAGRTAVNLWPYLFYTLQATLYGTAIGLVVGALTGLLFSQSRRLSEVMQPFIVMLNTVPRVALIPIFVIIARPTITAETLSVFAVVFFLAFFSSFEGGRSVSPAMIDNARLLGASSIGVMATIRLPIVIKWTFAIVPNAISFGLVIAVTTELLAGLRGMGQLLLAATTSLDTDLTFAVIVVLAVVGLVLYALSKLLYRQVVRW
jgi:NitT/TauT family transport system permease protein